MDQADRVNARISLDTERIAEFCRQWEVSELSFFGSVLRSDFHAGSDVDVLVTFAPDAAWSLLDHVQMQEDLSAILDRKVDLVSRRAIEASSNWIRRRAILETTVPVYAAG